MWPNDFFPLDFWTDDYWPEGPTGSPVRTSANAVGGRRLLQRSHADVEWKTRQDSLKRRMRAAQLLEMEKQRRREVRRRLAAASILLAEV